MSMDWDKLKIFYVVAKAGSFTHAGEALGLSQSAVSRQISSLEDSLDTKLFHRHARGLVLTEAGEIIHQTAKGIFAQLSTIEEKLADTKGRATGPLRITISEFIGSTWLVPKLAKLHEKFPDLELSLLLDDRVLNLNMSEADVAIRLYAPKQADLYKESLGKIKFHICGSKDYFKKHGVPKTVKDLKDHKLIGYPEGVPAPFENANWLFRLAEVNTENNSKLLKINSLYAIYEAVKNGAGLASLPDYLVAGDSKIDACLEKNVRPPVEMFFVCPEERAKSTRINVFLKFIKESTKKDRL